MSSKALRQRVNLYGDKLRPVPEVLPLSLAATLVAAAFGLLLLMTLTAYWLASNSVAELALAQQHSQQLTTDVAEQTARLQQRKPPALHSQRLQELQQELDLRRRLLGLLVQHKPLQQRDLGGLLDLLARHRSDLLWLQRISLSEQQLRLQGAALSEEGITRWLSALTADAASGPLRLQGLSIEEGKADNLRPRFQFQLEGQL